jgi:hypothetical protein
MIDWQQGQDSQGLATREFRISDEGRRDITGAVWLPTTVSTHDTLMCFGHGASGDRYQAPISDLAGRFVTELGIPVLSIDGPVHGLRQVGEGGRTAFGPEYSRADCLRDMTADWTSAIDATRQLPGVEASKLAYFGLSMGTIFGLPLVASRNDFTVATLGLFGVHERSIHAEAHLRDAGSITCPVFYLMQLEDELFSREGYLAAFDALGSVDKRIHANPGLHPQVPAREMHYAFEFLTGHITGTSQARTSKPIAE